MLPERQVAAMLQAFLQGWGNAALGKCLGLPGSAALSLRNSFMKCFPAIASLQQQVHASPCGHTPLVCLFLGESVPLDSAEQVRVAALSALQTTVKVISGQKHLHCICWQLISTLLVYLRL